MSYGERWIFVDIGDGQQFHHQYQQKSPLYSTHWVIVNNSTNINNNHFSPQLIKWNCWPSLNELNRGVIFVDIGGGIVDHHLMSCGEKWLLLILVELLTITQWVMVRGVFLLILVMVNNSTNINKNHLSPKLIELNCWPSFQWVEVRGDFGWYWWNCWPSLNEFRWEVIFVDIGGIVDHHSMWLGEGWFWLILVELLTIT